MASSENTARTPMFGNFDILETIGQGGMGVVYRAHDIVLNRDVALKVLKDELRENPRVVARFRREAEAIASLDHPRIVQVYSVGAVGNIPYFAMELIEGKPLHRILRRHKYLQWKPALRIARDVAEALDAAHEAGIIHRDIKPGNIIVDRQGTAYVSDFGIAKVLTAETQLTVDGSKLGTPQYMSPERVQNHDITAESDIYSLGVVLFQMLTGRMPYEAQDPVDLIRMIVVEPPRRVRDYKPELSEDIERLVAYMIEKKPQDRPRSASHVVELTNRLLEGKQLFESDSGIDDALEGLREEVSTPLSETSVADGTGLRATVTGLTARLRARWNGWPEWVKTGAIAAPVIACAFLLGSLYSAVGTRDRVPDIVQALSIDPSGWYRQAELARFYPEQAGVTIVELMLDEFHAGDARWTPGSAAVVEVIGNTGSGLCKVTAEAQAASLLVPIGGWRADHSLLTYLEGSGMAAVAQPDGEEFTMLLTTFGTGRVPSEGLVIAERVTEFAPHPHGDRIAVVRREGRAGRIVEEWTLDGVSAQSEVLFTSQQPVVSLGYSSGGSAVVFQEIVQTGRETNIVVPGEGRRRLTLGDVALPTVALNEAATRLIVLQDEANESRGVLFDAVTGARLQDLGNMLEAAWTSDGAIAYLAPDARGDIQLWRLRLTPSPTREQLISIDGGVEPQFSVRHADGAALVVPRNKDRPSLAFVEP